MARDIDYAAIAVKSAIVEKFGRNCDLQALDVTANDRTISVCDGQQVTEGTRDDLLASIRAAESYHDLWQSRVSRPKGA